MRSRWRNKYVLEWILLKKKGNCNKEGMEENAKKTKHEKQKKKQELEKMKTNMEDMLVHIVPVWGNIVANVC